MKKFVFLCLLFTVFLYGCSEENVQNIYGTYVFENEYVKQKLLLKPDGTFEQVTYVFKNDDFLKTNGTYNFREKEYKGNNLSLKGYLSILDFTGKLEKKYSRIPEHDVFYSFNITNYFGRRKIGFLEGCYYNKIKDWREGDTLTK